jgi:molybdenum cofactor cytidylyltransferase
MGYPKALLPLGPGTFLTRILDTVAEAGLIDPILVLGKDAPLIASAIAGRSLRTLINPDPSRGQLSSMQLAIKAAPSAADACLVWPVDQPAVLPEVVRGLVELFAKTRAPIVFPFCENRKGHPAIFSRSLFSELLEAPLEGGAKGVVLRHQQEAALLPTTDSSTILDIDTPEDYLRLTGKGLESILKR